MTTAEFIAHLRALDIRLSVDGERLQCSAPKGALTDRLREELAARKAETLAWLRASENGHDGATVAATVEEHHEPLSFAQQRLWFIEQLQPGGCAFNITCGIRMQGQLDVAALERSLGGVVLRHEPLRTVFVGVDGQPTQVVTPYREFRLPILDLEPRPTEARVRVAEDLMVEEGRRPFDLGQGPLFRARLYRLAPNDHMLQLTMHHNVADGWSLEVLFREMSALYQAHVDGRGGDLPPLPLRYAELLRRQRERLRGSALEKQETYWKSRLTPLPPVLEMPADFPRPALQTFNGAVETFLVPTALVERLQRLSRKHGVTLFMTLLAAFEVILHRYTGVVDIAVGAPIANRTDIETEAVIGLVANVLVLRVDVSGDPTFAELLLRVRDVALGGYAHQDFPFESVVEMVRPARDMSHSGLFQVTFLFQNFPFEVPAFPGLTLSYVEIRTGTAKTDLTLEVVERADGLGMYLEYSTDLFKADTIRRLCGHLERLLTAIVEDPTQRISRLPLLSEVERHRITVEWNATDVPEAAEGTVPRLFEAQAQLVPEAPAVRFEAQCLSYRELNRSVNRLAHYLRRHDVGPNVLVGILVERSLDMLVAVLAVMKAGGAYVPLDPAFPADRLAFMLQDARVSLVVTQAALLDRVSIPAEARSLCLDSDAGTIGAEPEDNPTGGAGSDDPAYVIYTSGSTGRPKGVQIAHRSLHNVLAAFRTTLGITTRDVLVSLTTLSFDIAALELFLPLATGAQLVIASRQVASDPPKLRALMADTGATIMQATPATWRMLLEAGWRSGGGLRILCGGEAFPPELAAQLLATGASVWNVYGPTETTIWSTIHPVDRQPGPVPIGRPIANTQTYVLDANGEPVPIGVSGELYIGGIGVTMGYLDRPELTAEKFVPDRFSGHPGARLYRTGDIARYRADGALEFLGRADYQIKIRGFRIEPGEIESVLTSHPAVAQAVVVTREDRPGDRYLAAYARLAGTAAPSGSELRAFLQERLPEYMVPQTVTVLAVFPMTPNGKVDRRQLPEPDTRRPVSPVLFFAPRSEIDRAIAQVWRDVLRLDEVGMDDNFFDLGGHSFLLVQVQLRLRERLGREVAIVEMFQYPTIRTMSTHLARQSTTSGAG